MMILFEADGWLHGIHHTERLGQRLEAVAGAAHVGASHIYGALCTHLIVYRIPCSGQNEQYVLFFECVSILFV